MPATKKPSAKVPAAKSAAKKSTKPVVKKATPVEQVEAKETVIANLDSVETQPEPAQVAVEPPVVQPKPETVDNKPKVESFLVSTLTEPAGDQVAEFMKLPKQAKAVFEAVRAVGRPVRREELEPLLRPFTKAKRPVSIFDWYVSREFLALGIVAKTGVRES